MAARLISPTGKPKLLGVVHPNVGLRIAYSGRLDRQIEAMAAAVLRALAAAWHRKPPELAGDESPAVHLRNIIRRLRDEWETKFEAFAGGFGRKAAYEGAAHTDRAFTAQLRKAGFTVKFRMTDAMNDVVQASITENVSLIRSIPAQYFTQIESIVSEGVRVGRDMHVIAQGLEHQLGVTKRRAAIIARDQTNKSTAAIVRVRQQEIGATHARWVHSGGGVHPRPSHVEMGGETYEIAKGSWDKDEQAWVWPGQLINCRCRSRTIVPGIG